MPQNITYGQLLAAVGSFLDAAQANLTLLNALNPEAVVGVSRPVDPGRPDWRCFCGVSDSWPMEIIRVDPPKMDWRCQVGIEVKVKDLVACLQMILGHGEVVRAMFEAELPGTPVPEI